MRLRFHLSHGPAEFRTHEFYPIFGYTFFSIYVSPIRTTVRITWGFHQVGITVGSTFNGCLWRRGVTITRDAKDIVFGWHRKYGLTTSSVNWSDACWDE